MSIHIINRANKNKIGTGLPFYSKVEYIFSNINKGYNSTAGLWPTPPDKIPTFQIEVASQSITAIQYRQTLGANAFTGVNINIPLAAFKTKAISKDGVPTFLLSSDYAYTLSSPIPSGRWVLFVFVADGLGGEVEYVSDEFIVTECCK